jgi:membrane-associated protease RseP (regulator of RpoE activity)
MRQRQFFSAACGLAVLLAALITCGGATLLAASPDGDRGHGGDHQGRAADHQAHPQRPDAPHVSNQRPAQLQTPQRPNVQPKVQGQVQPQNPKGARIQNAVPRQAQPGQPVQNQLRQNQQRQNETRGYRPAQPAPQPQAGQPARPLPNQTNDPRRMSGNPQNQAGRQPQQRPAQPVSPRNLGFALGAAQNNQLRINSVTPNSAAARIGIRQGDQIVSVGGQQINSEQQFNATMQNHVGRQDAIRNGIPIVVRRNNGALQTLYWTSVALGLAGYGPYGYGGYGYGPSYGGQYGYGAPYTSAYPQPAAFLGVDLDPNYPSSAIVSRVHPGSAADRAGLQPGDVISSLNGQPVQSLGDLMRLVAQLQPGDSISIRFDRSSVPMTAQAVLGRRGEEAQSVPTGAQIQEDQPRVLENGGPPATPDAPAPDAPAPSPEPDSGEQP